MDNGLEIFVKAPKWERGKVKENRALSDTDGAKDIVSMLSRKKHLPQGV